MQTERKYTGSLAILADYLYICSINIKNKPNMKQTFVLENVRTDTLADINRSVKAAREAYRALLAEDDLFPVPWFTDLDIYWLDELVEKKIEAVKASDHLTKKAQKQMIAEWEALKAKASRLIAVAVAPMRRFPALDWTFDEEGDPIPRNAEEVAYTLAERPVPAEAEQHAELIAKVREAVETLRAWEKAQDLHKINLNSLLLKSEDWLAEAWATNYIRIDRENEDARGRMCREITERQIV